MLDSEELVEGVVSISVLDKIGAESELTIGFWLSEKSIDNVSFSIALTDTGSIVFTTIRLINKK
ncbi:MAG: hypothetical protein E6269_07165 [Clostridiales bacterium]|nr:hypothetical protein [Clostridiales bacterium]